ncbi:3-oxoacyl-(acyl-carrier-protein) synthase [uncultured Desulfobacterium sp.]|uniref:3-oxoacyl-(Acyl-carrier-protein) synthase n=1 Tax=uncultured Desulfobacterium sp. TaxID=201089 RepID=A0A445MU81_9BACT|nr:3-oxoacyl-(acyl-carrier-protein) synthase [uncultured Desulfobacterium sp.]
MSRKVAITGIGICSSLGFSGEQIINNLKRGGVSFSRPSFDDHVVISPVNDFNIKSYTGSFKERRYLNRGSQFCVASAVDAIRSSGINKDLLSNAGLFMGTGPNLDIGGEFFEIQEGEMDRKDLMALWMLRFLPNTAASAIAMYAGIHGENLTVNTACAASVMAIGEAFRKIRCGYLDLALAGGGDSRLSRGGILAYKKANALYTGSGEADKAMRPFDSKRKGFVPGEGGAVFLLEEMDHAKRRGAEIYAEICGFGSSIDGHNMTAPEPSAAWAEKAVRAAISEAGVNPSDIDIVSSHGTGTQLNDEAEAHLLHRLFGANGPPVIAIKSWIGHGAAACGALELGISLICMCNNYWPEIRNLTDPCHMELNFVRMGRNIDARTILLENFGFGGQNGVLIIKGQ